MDNNIGYRTGILLANIGFLCALEDARHKIEDKRRLRVICNSGSKLMQSKTKYTKTKTKRKMAAQSRIRNRK